MRIPCLAAVLAAFLGVAAAVAVPALAQDDNSDLVDRVNRLERDLSILQSQVYRNQGGKAVITSPAAGGGISGDAYSTLDQRISAVEQQMRDLTGQVEQASHAALELKQRLDRMQADDDFRFKAIEQKLGGAPAAASGGGGQAAAPAAADGAGSSTMGSLPHPLGQMPEADLKRLEPHDTGTAAAEPATLPGKTPQEQYDYAFRLLRASDYDGADRAFRAFLGKHAKDPLAGNAAYWLAQIPYSQGKYDVAAPLFFDAYRKYPKSAKAPEALLRLGQSMAALKKKKEACAAFGRLASEFPDAGDSVKRQAAAERRKLACGSP